MARKRLTHYAGLLVALVVFGAAVWVLAHILEDLSWERLLEQLHALQMPDLIAALACTIAAYLTLTVYDGTAFAYVGRRMPYGRIAYVSFIAYAFSHNLGFPAVTGGSVRYRFYSYWGVPVIQIAAVILFGGAAYLLGLFAVAGVLILVSAEELALAADLPLWAAHALGAAAALSGLAYLFWSLAGRPVIRVKGTVFAPPKLRICLTQLGAALLEWSFASAALYVLLPADADVSYWHFIGIYVIAYVTGIVSQVPGGLGVFEAVVILLLPPEVATETVVAAIIVYRLFYYVLPLIVGAFMMAGSEVAFQRERAYRIARAIDRFRTRLNRARRIRAIRLRRIAGLEKDRDQASRRD